MRYTIEITTKNGDTTTWTNGGLGYDETELAEAIAKIENSKAVERYEIKEEKEMTNGEFTIDGAVYSTNDKGTYFYRTERNGKKFRIAKCEYEQAFERMIAEAADQAKADAERAERERKQAESDKGAEDAFNGKKTSRKETKKAFKPRKSKDIAYTYYESDGNNARAKVLFTLTAKQVDFIKRLPNSNFWENGVESVLWCDILADEIGGQFAGKPMTVGAMISTLREKDLVHVGKDLDRKGHPKFMELTEIGQAVAVDLGLQ